MIFLRQRLLRPRGRFTRQPVDTLAQARRGARQLKLRGKYKTSARPTTADGCAQRPREGTERFREATSFMKTFANVNRLTRSNAGTGLEEQMLLTASERPMTLLAPAAGFLPARHETGPEKAVVLNPSRAGASRRPRARPRETGLAWASLFAILATVSAARAFDVIPISECRAAPPPLAFAPITEMKMTTSAGAPCLLLLRLGAAGGDALTITVNPQHGVAVPEGGTGVIYRAPSGFRGEDAFWFSFDGPSNPNPGAAVVRVGVTVI
jgi:hypothetical protein